MITYSRPAWRPSLVLLVIFCFKFAIPSNAQCQTGTSGAGCIPCAADLPCDQPFHSVVEIPSCSLIIPMDNGYYTGVNRRGAETSDGTWNPKVIGLAVRLLHNEVPLRHLIRGGKTKTFDCDGIDFVKRVTQISPNDRTGDPSNAFDRIFRGGALVVPVRYSDIALDVINSFNNQIIGANSTTLYLGPDNFDADFLEYDSAYSADHQVNVYRIESTQPDAASITSLLGAPTACTNAADQTAIASLDGFKVPLHNRLNVKPFVAVFNSNYKNAKILMKYMQDAGMVRDSFATGNEVIAPLSCTCGTSGCPSCQPGAQYRIITAQDASSFSQNVCLTMVSEPHFTEVLPAAGPFLSAMSGFINTGGNAVIECGGIRTYEQCGQDLLGDNANCLGTYSDDILYMSSNGVIFGDEVSNDNLVEFPNADLPIAQLTGPWASEGGSVKSFRMDDTRTPTSQFQDDANAKAVGVVSFTEGGDFHYVATGKRNRTLVRGGVMTYLSGHKYVPSTLAGARIYLNAILIPAQRDQSCGLDIDDDGTLRRRGSSGGVSGVAGQKCNCEETYDACGVCGGVSAPGDCSGTTGGCCDGSQCTNALAPVQCDDLSGSFLGAGSQCPTGGSPCQGACCDGSTCSLVSDEASCSGTFFGVGSNCDGGCTGACCLDADTCTDTLVESCSGTFAGPGSSCATQSCGGACCFEGSCATTTESTCDTGYFFGLGTQCSLVECTGACCASDGGCASINVEESADCEGFQGAGTECSTEFCLSTPPSNDDGEGACCLPDDSCVSDAEKDVCRFVWQGTHFAGADCIACNTGACCNIDSGACEEVLAGQCRSDNLAFAGPGTTCAEAQCDALTPEDVAPCCLGEFCVNSLNTNGACEGVQGSGGSLCAPDTCDGGRPGSGACELGWLL